MSYQIGSFSVEISVFDEHEIESQQYSGNRFLLELKKLQFEMTGGKFRHKKKITTLVEICNLDRSRSGFQIPTNGHKKRPSFDGLLNYNEFCLFNLLLCSCNISVYQLCFSTFRILCFDFGVGINGAAKILKVFVNQPQFFQEHWRSKFACLI